MTRRGAILLGYGLAVLLVTILVPPAPRLVWNVSNSAPRGLYAVSPGAKASVGDMVVARVPIAWRSQAAARHYVPINVPLVKRVAAADGDRICGMGKYLTLNNIPLAVRLARDSRGRPLAKWQGCVTLKPHEYLLLMDGKASFDGRYFGPTGAGDIIGPARLIWPA